MSRQTALGLTYPEKGDHTRTWEWYQTLAENVDGLLAAGYVQGADYSVRWSGRTALVQGTLPHTLAINTYLPWPTGTPDWIKNIYWGQNIGMLYNSSGVPDPTVMCAIFTGATGIAWFRSGYSLPASHSFRFCITGIDRV